MTNDKQIKEIVKQKYSAIALQDKETNSYSCCGSGSCSTEVYNIMSEDYTELDGYNYRGVFKLTIIRPDIRGFLLNYVINF